jgi:prophage regulatory protein
MESPRFERLPEVLRRVGVGRSTLYRWIEAGQFPGPVRLGPNTSAWLASDVDRWIAKRVKQASEVTA